MPQRDASVCVRMVEPREVPSTDSGGTSPADQELDRPELALSVELWLLAVQRVGYSPIAYPVLALIIGLLTPLGEQRTATVTIVTLGTALLAALRLWHVHRYAAEFVQRPNLHRFLFCLGALSCGLLFALLSCVSLMAFGVAPTTLTCLLVLAGLVAGGTASLAADLYLARLFVATTLFPPAVACFIGGHPIPVAVPVVILCCVAFYLALTRQMCAQAAELLLNARALRQQREQLVAAKSKAEAAAIAKGAFLATMSHELRTPLNGVIGMTELLSGTTLDVTQRDYTNTLRSAADGLRSLINDILDFSKIESGKLVLERVSFELPNLVREVVKLLQPQARSKGITLDYKLDPLVSDWVIGDPVRLRQMLLNLTGNAVKFTDSGSVQVNLLRDAEDPLLTHFSVKDTGIGIPDHKQADIFAEFMQGDTSVTRRYGGTGLGLAITQRLARAMGSEVILHSEVGVGSTFSFSMAFAQGEARAPSNTEVVALPRPLRVLVVDDNSVNRKVATRLLERLQCSFHSVENGLLACQEVEGGNYDAILMDCMMPVLDGYSATRRLREQGVTIPIVAMTANCQPDDIARCKDCGMDAHLAKPVKLAELAATLRNCLR